MTQDQARQAMIDLGFSPFNVDLLCQQTNGGDFVAWYNKSMTVDAQAERLLDQIDTGSF